MILPANNLVAEEADQAQEQNGPGDNDQLLSSTDKSALLVDALMYNNRFDRLTQVMAHHPHYLEPFLRTHNFILRGDGPLPFRYRHYIAIMAAARHQCSYLVNLQKQEFTMHGDMRWLQGLDQIPQKLRDLNEINKILAHQPWLFNKSHIEKLTRNRDDSWSVSELVHAIVLLAHFHALSSLVFSCGINDDYDTADSTGSSSSSSSAASAPSVASTGGGQATKRSTAPGDMTPPSPPSPPSGSPVSEGTVEALLNKMQSMSEQKRSDVEGTGGATDEDLVKGFQDVDNAEMGPPSPNGLACPRLSPLSSSILPSDSGTGGKNSLNSTTVLPDLLKYVDDKYDFCYVDFARRRESDLPTFRVQDYSWDDHGFSLVNQLYDNVGNLLDRKFKLVYNLTYYTMGRKTNVDTSMFRRAIWNYIQCIYGIRHDDYDYHEVNELLDRNLKAYIKSCCCYPQRTGRKDCDNVMREFRRSEKIHVNLMIAEARMQAELLYALRAVMKYMT
ncbi:Sestrin-3 [Halotydeus destructor]|nr:Sestrin-3 [Halotydeus destructor]